MVNTFYKVPSIRDKCSLPHIRLELERSNVDGKVKGKYQAHNDFIHTVGSGFLMKLSMDKLNMETVADKPDVEGLPANIARTHTPRRTDVFEQMVGQIVDEIYKPFTPTEPGRIAQTQVHVPGRGLIPVDVDVDRLEREEEIHVDVPINGGMHRVQVQLDDVDYDDLYHYSSQFLQWYIHWLEFEDAIKEGDIVRCNICIKMMIPFFYGYNTLSKYAVECIDYILKTELLLPAAHAIRCRLGSFCNPTGMPGDNKPADMQQENNILVLKDVIKGLGANKSEKAMVRASLAAPVADGMVQQYMRILGMHQKSGRRTKKSDDTDVLAVLELINASEPLEHTPGRRMVHYRGIKPSAFGSINKGGFLEYLTRTTGRLKRGQAVDF